VQRVRDQPLVRRPAGDDPWRDALLSSKGSLKPIKSGDVVSVPSLTRSAPATARHCSNRATSAGERDRHGWRRHSSLRHSMRPVVGAAIVEKSSGALIGRMTANARTTTSGRTVQIFQAAPKS